MIRKWLPLLMLTLIYSCVTGQNFFWSHARQFISPCDAGVEYTGGQTYPTTTIVNLGTDTGNVFMWYSTYNIPDLFLVYYDGELVYNSGYGSFFSFFSYDIEESLPGEDRQDFINALGGKIDPLWETAYPDYTHYPWDGYPQVTTPGTDTTLVFYKATNTPTTATIEVYAPMTNTSWDFKVFCPVPSVTWDYSGTLTVGYLEWHGSDYYGWISSVYGSINPTTIQVSGFSATTGVYYNDTAGELHVEDNSGKKSCNTIEIDGVSYSGFNSSGILAVGSNPFPAEDETCTIKLK